MSYVEKHLLQGEQVTYQTRLHKVIFLIPVCLAALGALKLFGAMETRGGGWLLFIGLVWGGLTYLAYTRSEFAVTNRRVIAKAGVIRTHSLDLQKPQIESVAINQGIFGRLFGYGNIVVGGTGGTKETFKYIAHPFELRNAVQTGA